MNKPSRIPNVPYFSSGPCAKRPGWSLASLQNALLARSHRSSDGKARIKEIIDGHRVILGIPDDYLIAVTPASDTGAIEMAMWSLLGPRPVDVLAFETFSKSWADDVVAALKIKEARVLEVPFGDLPNLTDVKPDHDCVFVWNGTTSGVAIPHAGWIRDDRAGLMICDATSAVFAYDLPWMKLDVVTWSWQKATGGEAAHGMIALSPRAVQRLTTYTPSWPMPKIFRLTKKGALIDGIFAGETINTPSLLCVEDIRDALTWVGSVGGLKGTIARVKTNSQILYDWAAGHSWLSPLPVDPATRSVTSVCFRFSDPAFLALLVDDRQARAKKIYQLLEDHKVAFDIASYRDAPLGLRIWCGATVEADDLRALTPWLEWAYQEVMK
jgi:phosphoserine aminotransferase